MVSQLRCPICSDSFSSPNNLRSHITRIHSVTDIFNTNSQKFTDTKLYLCRHCNVTPNIYLSEGNLTRHVKSKHPLCIRTDTNLELIKTYLPTSTDTITTSWHDAIQFLTNLNITEPPPFRRTTWSKLTKSQKRNFITQYDIVINLVLKASIPLADELSPTLSSPDPF